MGNFRAIAALAGALGETVAAAAEREKCLTSLTVGRVLGARVSTLIPPCVQVTRYAGRLPASMRSEAGGVETVMLGGLVSSCRELGAVGPTKELLSCQGYES
jgi:hypothetical protein